MQQILARRAVGPNRLSGIFVQSEKTGRIWRGNIVMRFVDTVGRIYKEQITHHSRRATGHIMRMDPEPANHIESPNDLRLAGGRIADGRETNNLGPVGDYPKPIALDDRIRANSLQRPIDLPSGRMFFDRMLPKKTAAAAIKRQ